MFLIITSVIAVALLSLVTYQRMSNKVNNGDNDYIYHGRVTAWREATESTALYIYYKQGNGVRDYYAVTSEEQQYSNFPTYLYVFKNPDYQSAGCNDFRRKYKYYAGRYPKYYFNATLTYMQTN